MGYVGVGDGDGYGMVWDGMEWRVMDGVWVWVVLKLDYYYI